MTRRADTLATVRTLITVREPGADPIPLVIEGDRFTDPDDGPIDDEIRTGHLYALPGLADCHAHLGVGSIGQMGTLADDEIRSNCVSNAWMQVEGGVLLIADKGSSSDVSLEILEAPPIDTTEDADGGPHHLPRPAATTRATASRSTTSASPTP